MKYWLLAMCLCFSHTIFAKEWKGIRPLHSDKATVEKALKGYKKTVIDKCRIVYDNPDERVSISYTCSSCSKGSYFNLPEGTVEFIFISLKKKVSLSELEFDLNSPGFQRYPNKHAPDVHSLLDDAEGFGLEISVRHQRVQNYLYRAPRKEIDEKRCK